MLRNLAIALSLANLCFMGVWKILLDPACRFFTKFPPSPNNLVAILLNRNFHFELPLHPKTYASYPVVSIANRPGLFEVVVRHILAVLRSRCAGFACPACLAADTCPSKITLSPGSLAVWHMLLNSLRLKCPSASKSQYRASGFHQPLLQTRQRPVVDPLR